MQTFRAFKRLIMNPFRIAEYDETIVTLEGDAILSGINGENWPIEANKFGFLTNCLLHFINHVR